MSTHYRIRHKPTGKYMSKCYLTCRLGIWLVPLNASWSRSGRRWTTKAGVARVLKALESYAAQRGLLPRFAADIDQCEVVELETKEVSAVPATRWPNLNSAT